jgi:excisionase family DNA binding protein
MPTQNREKRESARHLLPRAGTVLIWFSVKCVLLVMLQIVMDTETYTVYEAARQLNCTSQWIRVLLAEQRLCGARKVDGQWRIPASALQEVRQRQVLTQ